MHTQISIEQVLNDARERFTLVLLQAHACRRVSSIMLWTSQGNGTRVFNILRQFSKFLLIELRAVVVYDGTSPKFSQPAEDEKANDNTLSDIEGLFASVFAGTIGSTLRNDGIGVGVENSVEGESAREDAEGKMGDEHGEVRRNESTASKDSADETEE